MPRDDQSAYNGKQKRQAEHIEQAYEKNGLPPQEAERRAWATVNKQDGGARPGPKAKHPARRDGIRKSTSDTENGAARSSTPSQSSRSSPRALS